MAKLKALAKIDEAQAKTTALAKVRGTAGVTELSDENGKPVWDVEVTATDGTMHDVTVDAVTGTIVTSETND